MSERYFRIAAPGAVLPFADALLHAFREVPAGDAVVLPSLFEAEAWVDRQLYEALILYEDNDWAVLVDLTCARCEREPALAEASRRLGKVVSAAHQDSVGFFQLLVFESGGLRRRVEADSDGRDRSNVFSSEQLDEHWQSFGLRPYRQDPRGVVTVIPNQPLTPPAEPRRGWRRWLGR